VPRLRGALVVVVVLVAACARDDGATPAPGPTSTTTSTTTSAPSAASPQLLVAHDDGIDLWTPDGTTPILTGRAVAVAVPDGRGGIVFQGAPADPTGAWPGPSAPVELLTTPGTDPIVVAVDADALGVAVVQVTEVDGRPAVLLRRWVEDPNDCPTGDEAEPCRWQYVREELVLHDLASGADPVLGTIGEFESSRVDVRLGGDVGVVAINYYGDDGACAGSFPAPVLVERDDPAWIGAGGLLDEWCRGEPVDSCPEDAPCVGSAAIGIAADGSRAAWAVSGWRIGEPGGERTPTPLTLTVRDLAGHDAALIVEIGGPAVVATSIDVGDRVVLVGRREAGRTIAPVLVGADGDVRQLDLRGPARLVVG